MVRKTVIFSKRKSSVFNKASELCTLCGAEIAIVAFSPGNHAFAFGHPSVESVIQRFLRPNNAVRSETQLGNLRELNEHLTEIVNRLEAERRRGEELSRRVKESRAGVLTAPIKELDLEGLERLKVQMEKLKIQVSNERELMLIAEEMEAAAAQAPFPPQFTGAAPSGSSRGGGIVVVEYPNVSASGDGT